MTTTRRWAARSPTQVDIKVDNPSSMLSGEAFLARVFNAYRSATSETGANVWNTALLIGWDEPGGTYDHVPPGPVPPPDPSAPPGECGFTFDRSGYRVPAIIVSPWVESGSVYNEEYRHTSLIATLRKAWGLGDAFTQRDASARTFDHVFSLDTPRDPKTWATVTAAPVPEWTMDPEVVGKAPEHPRQGHGARPHRQGQRDGRAAPRRTQRSRMRSSHPDSSSRSSGTSPVTSSRFWVEMRRIATEASSVWRSSVLNETDPRASSTSLLTTPSK